MPPCPAAAHPCLPTGKRRWPWPAGSTGLTTPALQDILWQGAPHSSASRTPRGSLECESSSPCDRFPSRPSCPPLDCGRPPPLAHGHLTGRTHLFGSRLEVVCDRGYIPKGGREEVHCGVRGMWEMGGVDCEVVRCGLLPPPNNGAVVHTGHQDSVMWRGIATFTCDSGHQLVPQDAGAGVAECQEDGAWSNPAPQCQSRFPPPTLPRSVVPSSGNPGSWVHGRIRPPVR